ncbi:protein TIFY 10c-like isoform X2 [Miscanthus floridulus]|uniref:protein TIFY 10c-like isoform X2 n=1 Tax=Miscanthus floridulus TaxID=154761 RepID=UPI00345AB5E6
MAGRAPATARDKTSFAATCSLLSQYLKEKKGALQGLGGLAMAPAPAAGAGALRPPTTMNLLSALDAPAEEPSDAAKATIGEPKDHDKRTAGNPREAAGDEAQQLTIFYGGKVVVFDKFPATKVKDLLQIVNPGGDGVDKAGATVPTQNLPTPSHSSLSDLPIARSNSLHRFLEKRKDRITAKAPYQVNSSVGVEAPKQAAGVEKKPWLGLGTVKQEI